LCETVSIQYARYLDAKDWQGLPSVFAPDGVWEVLSNRMEGREAIQAYWQSRTADWAEGHGRVHQISNQVIEVIDRDRARGSSMVMVYFFDTRPGMNESLVPSLIARNEDEFIRTEEGWKLLRRTVHRVADLAAH
jgi:3-phenylpropionate/cinnamic acid dioxygenase small subunit